MLNCPAQGHNTVPPVRLQSATPRFQAEHLQETTRFERLPWVLVIRYFTQYHLHHPTYPTAKFKIGTSYDSGSNAFTRRKIHDLTLDNDLDIFNMSFIVGTSWRNKENGLLHRQFSFTA